MGRHPLNVVAEFLLQEEWKVWEQVASIVEELVVVFVVWVTVLQGEDEDDLVRSTNWPSMRQQDDTLIVERVGETHPSSVQKPDMQTVAQNYQNSVVVVAGAVAVIAVDSSVSEEIAE